MILVLLLVYKGKGVLAAKLGELKEFNKKFPVLFKDVLWGVASIIYSIVYGHMVCSDL